MKTEEKEENYNGVSIVSFKDEHPSHPFILVATRMKKTGKKEYLVNCRYPAEANREKAITTIKGNVDAKIKDLELKSQIRKSMKNPFNVGDVFHDSWGYDQTNNNFYMIVSTSEKTVEMVEIGKVKVDGENDLSYNVKPDPKSIVGVPFKKMLQVTRNGDIRIKANYGGSLRHYADLNKSVGESKYH